MNSITELLDLENLDIIISDITIQGTTKTLTLETKPSAHFCPSCGIKMHSRGIKKRVAPQKVWQTLINFDDPIIRLFQPRFNI